jgi:transcriptional regulator with XRE-family HTH domain
MVEDELQRQIKEQLESKKKAGLSVADIAAKLDVGRATVYQLMKGKTTPDSKVLCNSCRNLQMHFVIDGHRIGAVDFPPTAQKQPSGALQLGLFDLSASADGDELRVTVKKLPSRAIELDVRLVG